MKNKIICIPIETKVREFDAKMLLATHLLNLNYTVYIGSRKGIIREIRKINNAVYFAKNISKSQKSFYEELKTNNNLIYSQDVEGGVLEIDEKSSILSSYPKDVIHLIDGIFLFGSKIKNILLNQVNKINSEALHCSGDLRFDLLNSKYRPFYEEDINLIKKKYGKFILINTSFSLANPFVGLEKLKDFYKKSLDLDPSKKEKILFKQEYYVDIIELYIHSILKLSLKFKNIKFIIRPHPSESLKIYNESFKSSQNVIVNNDGNVHNWIYASLGVIHYDCTTGIESLIANKPTIAYVPKKHNDIFAWLPAYVSKEAKSIEELFLDVNSIINNNFNHTLSKTKKDILKEYIYNIDKSSIKVIINELSSAVSNTNPTNTNIDLEIYLSRIKSIIKSWKNKILLTNKNSITMKKFGGINKSEVECKINKLKNIENFKFKFLVKKLGSDVVSLSRK